MGAMTVHITTNVTNPEGYRALSDKMSAFVRDNEPGTVIYDWHLSEDGSTGFNVDGFDSTSAFLTHMGNAQEHGFLDEYLACVEITSVLVTGAPSAEADPVMEQFGAAVLQPLSTL